MEWHVFESFNARLNVSMYLHSKTWTWKAWHCFHVVQVLNLQCWKGPFLFWAIHKVVVIKIHHLHACNEWQMTNDMQIHMSYLYDLAIDIRPPNWEPKWWISKFYGRKKMFHSHQNEGWVENKKKSAIQISPGVQANQGMQCAKIFYFNECSSPIINFK